MTDFHQDGYVIFDNFFSPAEMADFEWCLSQLPDTDLGAKYDALSYTPSFLRLASNRKTSMMANVLLGRNPFEPLYCFSNRCLIQMPNDESRTYGWHQEVFYSIPKSHFVQTWAPLVYDTTKENGTIEVLVGSHKEGIARQVWNEQEGRVTQIIVDDETVSKYEHRVIEMKVGQMMFFDSRLIHRSGQNTSDKPRYSMVGMYHAITKDFQAPKPRFEYRGQSPKEWYAETDLGNKRFNDAY